MAPSEVVSLAASSKSPSMRFDGVDEGGCIGAFVLAKTILSWETSTASRPAPRSSAMMPSISSSIRSDQTMRAILTLMHNEEIPRAIHKNTG